MTSLNSGKYHIAKGAGLFLFLLVISGIFLFVPHPGFERIKVVHIEKEKKTGDEEVNHQLYLYYEKFKSDKYIVTDYMYLSLLPGINKFFKFGRIQDLKPTDPLLADEKTGFLLMSTLYEPSKVLPEFIQDSLRTGKYAEIFSINDCVFIKIR